MHPTIWDTNGTMIQTESHNNNEAVETGKRWLAPPN